MSAPSQLQVVYSLATVLNFLVILTIMMKCQQIATILPDSNQTQTNNDVRAVVDRQYSGGKVLTGFGYVLATGYSDQMTSGGLNIVSLQCWARAISKHPRWWSHS